jgi:TRAP-type C4-dicarboxylate transport system permease small subunit
MRKLRALEDLLIRVESALAVVLVLTMLLLAAYNVVYRNVLVPLQNHWAHSGPPVQPTTAEPVPTEGEPAPTDAEDAKADAKQVDSAREGGADDFGGFGGLGEEDDEGQAGKPEAKGGADDFGGFGGLDDGGDDAKPEPDAKAVDAKAPAADEGLGDAEDELGEDDLGDEDQFANLPAIDAVAKQSADAIPQGGPPPPGSFAAWAVAFIDDIKLDWIDVFLRQLVIIVAFFGAMLATQRGKHINVDALSKLLPRSARRVVGVLLPLTAVAVCLVLAKAGWDLVQIGRAYPKDLLPSVPEWSLQLMFPVGFGLLAVHFAVRMVEAAVAPPDPDAPLRSASSAAVVAVEDGGDAPQKGGR